MHKGYEYVESERDDVNGLPDLWDIDRLARYLSVSKHFVYPPLLPPGVRLRATRGGHQPAFWRDAAGRQRTESFDTAAEADAADKRSRGTRDGRYRPTQLGAQASQRLVAEMDGNPSTSSGPLAPEDESIRTCQIEPVFGKMRLAGPGCAVATSPGRTPTWERRVIGFTIW